jgi:hypothetical protein
MLKYAVQMTSLILTLAILGHMIGDYLLQSTWMAITKSKKGFEGIIACTVHVVLYTVAVSFMIQTKDPTVWALIFVPHWIIDHWSLGELWLKMIGGRTKSKLLLASGLEREFGFAFYAPVYIAVDNTLHFVCLWAMIWFYMV